MTDTDAELDAIVAMLTDAGMVEEYADEDGRKPAMRSRPMASGWRGRWR